MQISDAIWQTWSENMQNLNEDSSAYLYPEHELQALTGLPPDRWPVSGQKVINWDLSEGGRKHTIGFRDSRILQPGDETDYDTSRMVVGRASFCDTEPLLNTRFRWDLSWLWGVLDDQKLAKVILHISKGWPLSPVYLCLHEEGFLFLGEGNHRYQVVKSTGIPDFYFLADQKNTGTIDTLLPVEWLSSKA